MLCITRGPPISHEMRLPPTNVVSRPWPRLWVVDEWAGSESARVFQLLVLNSSLVTEMVIGRGRENVSIWCVNRESWNFFVELFFFRLRQWAAGCFSQWSLWWWMPLQVLTGGGVKSKRNNCADWMILTRGGIRVLLIDPLGLLSEILDSSRCSVARRLRGGHEWNGCLLRTAYYFWF